MSITTDPKILLARYQIALEGGLVDVIKKAIEGTAWTAQELVAIGSRETGYLWGSHWGKFHDWKIIGDHGNGYGWPQIDRRSHYDFTVTMDWMDPYKCALKAIEVLEAGKNALTRIMGSDGVEPSVSVEMELEYSAYNCGPRNAWLGYKNHGDASIFTTDHDYGKDVLAQVEIFGKIMEGA